MLSVPAVEYFFDDDDWVAPPPETKLYRAASVGNSWGVTSIGRGFDWDAKQENSSEALLPAYDEGVLRHKVESFLKSDDIIQSPLSRRTATKPRSKVVQPISVATHVSQPSRRPESVTSSPTIVSESPSRSPTASRVVSSSLPSTPSSLTATPVVSQRPPPPARSPTLPRPRRRSSQQRVSLVAGRVLIAPMEPPSPPPPVAPELRRLPGSQTSLLSVASSTGPPTPQNESFLGERSVSDFFIEKEIGRGAYGLVKLAREKLPDGTLGPAIVLKQIIKSRILADCWKKHPKYGTIPIEIYVMSSMSSVSYALPARRPWDPHRPAMADASTTADESSLQVLFKPSSSPDELWVEGKVVKGHPNVCPLLEFFEDNHYYYLVLPSTAPEVAPYEHPPPSDLFDLVENYPRGLPTQLVRSYLGQIADALCFLHGQGIVHRDVKDENVVLGPSGKAILIDFGSSGLMKRGGWDTFSGTLDYAGPEILRGERYQGKEQDVWAFGVVAYVLLVGECPFTTAAEAQEGLESPFATASMALDERCGDDKEQEGEEADGGGALGDAAALVKACLKVDLTTRPSFEKILQSRFLSGYGGWGLGDSCP